MKYLYLSFFLTGLTALAQNNYPQEEVLLRKKIVSSQCYKDTTTFRGCLAVLDSIAFEKNGENIVPHNFSWFNLRKIYSFKKNELKQVNQLSYQKNSFESRSGIVNRNFKLSIINHHIELDRSRDHLFKTSKKINFEKELNDLFLNLDHDERALLSVIGLTNYEIEASSDGHASYLSATLPTNQKRHDTIGIGVQFTHELSGLRIKDVIAGSAAHHSGLKAGDLIIKINHKGPNELGGIRNFPQYLFDEEGTELQLEFFRGNKLSSTKLVRVNYRINLSESKKIDYHGDSVGYIKLRTFDYLGGCQDVKEAVNQFVTEGVKGIILDLRNNGGGHEGQARCIAGIFLRQFDVLYKFHNPTDNSFTDMTPANPDPEFFEVNEHDMPFDRLSGSPASPPPHLSRFPVQLPLVVLLNSGSASASEMLAGGLRDNLRALIVGERSFGKGCGQKSTQVSGTGLFVMSTKYYFLRPSGSSVQQVGIHPDFLVPGPESLREMELVPHGLNKFGKLRVPRFTNEREIRNCVDELVSGNNEDPQIEKGLKVLSCIFR